VIAPVVSPVASASSPVFGRAEIEATPHGYELWLRR